MATQRRRHSWQADPAPPHPNPTPPRMRTNGFVGPLPASLNLVESFTEWTWANNCFHDHVVAFALRHQDALLAAPPGEHSHAVHSLHTEFAEGLESFVEGFLSHHGATMEQFSAALTEHHDSADLATRCTLEVVTEVSL